MFPLAAAHCNKCNMYGECSACNQGFRLDLQAKRCVAVSDCNQLVGAEMMLVGIVLLMPQQPCRGLSSGALITALLTGLFLGY